MECMDLNGEWRVRKKGANRAIGAVVPGGVYGDLLAAGEIPDPFYRDNENELQWIGEADWSYGRRFTVPGSLLRRDRVLLRCEGLDTFARVRLNGTSVGRADNMFRTWEWDVKPLLKPGANRIEIDFASTIPYSEKRQAERPIPWWGQARSKERAACHAWVRKQACNFGWDWGIKAVTCGIWRPIRLVAYDTARIEDMEVLQDHGRRGVVGLRVNVRAGSTGKAALAATVRVSRSGRAITEAEVQLKRGRACAGLEIRRPELWWPNNMGGQPLYDVSVVLHGPGGERLDEAHKRIGLRSLHLDRHADKWGESFQFVVNGVPFFTKGANWIPADGILSRMTPDRYRALVHAAAQANMNMLRVWGGGIYEDDSFYEACDEFGICIWQDFMFSCSTYPTFDKAFMKNVEAEARDQVARLRHHPCIALWCGNNELEQGLAGDRGWDRQMPWKEYAKLFDKLLPDVIRALDPQRPYWPGSPHTPVGDRSDFNSPASGDAHLWSVWHGKKPFEWYRTCEHRFNSEFGFQSFPEPKTVYGYTEPEDRNITSWVMEHHQRSGIGNTTIMQYMLDWFRLPLGFENTLWASQILQGMAIKYACEHWRRSMPRGMGTLYWQINDTWPVASWSSIDYHGRWKALHYMARAFYAPVIVSGLEDASKGTVEVHVTSDLAKALRGTVRWTVTDTAGAVLAGAEEQARVPARSNRRVFTLDLAEPLSRYGSRNLLVWMDLDVDGETVSRNLVLFARPKHLELAADPGVRASVRECRGGVYAVTLKARRPALWAWIELEGVDAQFSDNFVHLRPGVAMEFMVTPSQAIDIETFRERLMVRSLVDTYRG